MFPDTIDASLDVIILYMINEGKTPNVIKSAKESSCAPIVD